MNITIKKLTPALAEDYLHFFDVTPHDTNIEENKCYCVTWRSDASYENAAAWFPTREERRARAAEFVKNGSLQGYLAYCDDEVVGWCNANAHCRLCVEYLRSSYPIEENTGNAKIKSVFCFVVAPKMQRMGIATKLLEAVVKDAAIEGFDFVEGYCNQSFVDAAHDFRGPLAMYEKCGFVACAERDGKVVVRKALK